MGQFLWSGVSARPWNVAVDAAVRPEIVRILKADFGWMLISFYRCGATEAQDVGWRITAVR